MQHLGATLTAGGNAVRDIGTTSGDPLLWAIGTGLATLGTVLASHGAVKVAKTSKAKKAEAPKAVT